MTLAPFLASLKVTGSAFRNGPIRRVTLAFFAYNAVEFGAWTAILVYAYNATGPASVGIVAVAQLLPSALLAPLLASLGDRYSRNRLLTAWYLIQGGTLAVTGLAALAGAPPLIVYALSLLATIAVTQTRPIQAALLPDLAESPAQLTAANALAGMGEGIGGLFGPLAVGLILATWSAGAAFVSMGAVLLAVGLWLAILDRRAGRARAAWSLLHGADDEPDSASSPGGLLAGLRMVATDADVLVVTALLTGRLVIYGGVEILVVLIAIDLLAMGDAGAGYLAAAIGLGTIAGGAAAFSLVGRRRLALWLGVAAVMIGIPIALIGVAPEPRSTAVLLALAGIGLAVLDVAGQTLLQRITPDAIRARVFGALEGLQLIGEAFGSLVILPVVLLFGIQTALILLGALLPVLALLAVHRFERIDARVVLPERELAVVRAAAIFRPLGPAALETLARHLRPVAVAAGTVVIREGEHGDRFYIIETGRVDVSVQGELRRPLEAGGSFGEIALLRDVPRTATVTAVVDTQLWALDREEFLAAVTGSGPALQEAERVAATRLD